MKTTLLTIGKTDAAYLQTGIGDYVGRLGHYIPFEMVSLPDVKNVKNLTEEQQKVAEGKLLLQNLEVSDQVILLDEVKQGFDHINL